MRGDKLCRGIQAPLGASRDPLDPNRDLATDPERFSLTATSTEERLTQQQIDEGTKPAPLSLVSGVLYFGIRFWTSNTKSWDEPLSSGGPEEIWDSTRGLTLTGRDIHVENPVSSPKQLSQKKVSLPGLDARVSDANFPVSAKRSTEFAYYKATQNVTASTLYNYLPPVFTDSSAYDTFFDTSDDVFPRRVQITLVVTSTRGSKRGALLKAPLTLTSADVIEVDDTTPFRADLHHYVKIDEEWIKYSHIKGEKQLVIRAGGRGARGTAAVAHAARNETTGKDTEVLTGTTVIMTLELPSYRESQ